MVGAALGFLSPLPATAITVVPPVLGPGRVVAATPGAHMTAPADGRLRTEHFLASVTSVAWPTLARAGGHEIAASSDHRLVVFSLTLSEPGSDVTPVTPDLPKLSLEVGKRSLPVTLTGIQAQLVTQSQARLATAMATYAAAVPDGTHRVVLAMTQGTFTQRFDLWTLRRIPPAPAVLYRAPTSPYVTASVEGTGTLTITDPQTGTSAPVDLRFLQATLTEWAPGGSNAPAPKPTDAFLWVRLLGTDKVEQTGHSATQHFQMHTLPATRLVFMPAGGHPVAASSAPFTPGVTGPIYDDGLFDADYWFVVPASVTTGALTVSAGRATGASCTILSGCGATTTDTTSAATLALSFPDPSAPGRAQRRPHWIGARLPPTGRAALDDTNVTHHGAGRTPASGSGGISIWAALAVLVVLAVAVLVGQRALRRRRRGLAIPVAGGSALDVNDAEPLATVQRPSEPPAAPAHGGVAAPVTSVSTAGAGVPGLGGDGDLVVRVVGHVEISGWNPASDRRLLLEDLCCFLALHTERALSSNELLEAIWSLDGERGDATTLKTVHNTVGYLRQGVGPEHLPDAAAAGGYRLQGVVSDWGEIERLLGAAVTEPAEESRGLRAQALAHVRGAPFEGAHATQFHWGHASGLASQMVRTVTDCAHELSAELLDVGDPTGAEWAARQGLKASRDDEALWLDTARAAKVLGVSSLARVWRDAAAALGAPRLKAIRSRLEG